MLGLPLILAAATLLGGACDQLMQSGSQPVTETRNGSLSVSMESVEGQSLLPDISMEPTRYEVSGTGPNEQSFSVETGQSTVLVGDLLVGEWSVTVDAYNDTDDHIGSGTGTVGVEAGEISALSIVVRSLTGPGTLTLGITWSPEEVSAPQITGRLIADDGSEDTLEFTMPAEGRAESRRDDLDSGFYTLALQLYDGDEPVAGAVTTARIVQDAPTEGAFDFANIGENSGAVDLVITPELDDPLVVSISGASDSIFTGESMSVSGSVEEAGGEEVFYTWYLNGSRVDNGETVEVGAALNTGFYRLDLIAVTSDGRRAGSASHTFVVQSEGDSGDDQPSEPEPEYDFIDTFEASTIDTSLWQVGTWTEHGGRLSAERTYIEDDMLVLEFEYDTDYYEETGLFKSSAIQTRRDDFRFGRWEARLKPTDEDGVLPTMYTIDWRDGGSQTRQEIDIEFVTVNISDNYSEVHLAVHGGGFASWDTQVELPFNPANDFHVWGFDITEDRVQWFVDDIILYEYWYDEQPGVIDAPYSLKFNFWSARLQDGGAGNWIQGPPVANTELHFYIDWVRFMSYE